MNNQTHSTTSFTYLVNLTCSGCRKEFPVDQVNAYCPECQTPLLAQYNLPALKQQLQPAEILQRPRGIYRWHELLPIQSEANCVTLGEGDTPLLQLEQFGVELGFSRLWLKDESHNPSGSYKARGISTAVSKARELSLRKVFIQTIGNTAGPMAAYASRGGLQAKILMPKDTHVVNLDESRLAGAEVVLVDGLINETPGKAGEQARADGWFDLSTFKEPYRVEGMKTLGFEIAEAFDWSMPDVIICPVGSGAGLVGIWKAFQELQALGWLKDAKAPRLVAVQAKGCSPIVKAFDLRASYCDFWTNARTAAAGLRIPKSFGDQLVLSTLSESAGVAVAVSDEAMLAAQRQLGENTGILPTLEGAATLAALIRLAQQKWLQPDERIVLLNTGSGLKYLPHRKEHPAQPKS